MSLNLDIYIWIIILLLPLEYLLLGDLTQSHNKLLILIQLLLEMLNCLIMLICHLFDLTAVLFYK